MIPNLAARSSSDLPQISVAKADTPKEYDQVVSYLSDQILNGSIKEGDRLISERELSARLNISRPIVREALRSLAMLGVLEIRQGLGTFVKTPDASNLGQLFTFMIGQKDAATDDIMEVRVALERQAVKLACERRRSSDVDRLEQCVDQIVATIDDPVDGGKADYDFHDTLVKASHSPALIMIYGIVSLILQEVHVARRRRVDFTRPRREQLIHDHRDICIAVRERNIELAAELIERHFA